MPIYDLSYRHWEGKLTSHWMRWWIIAKSGLRLIAKRRFFVVLFIGALSPFIWFAFYVIASSGLFKDLLPSLPELLPGIKLYTKLLLDTQLVCCQILTLLFAPGLIANDIQTKALQFYLSKPITKADYFLGKLSIIGLLLLLITAVPGLLLFGLKIAVTSQKLDYVLQYWWVPGAVILFSVLMVLFFSFTVLLFSSISKNATFAAIKYASFFYLLHAASAILRESIDRKEIGQILSILSPQTAVKQIGKALFGMESLFSLPTILAFLFFFLISLVTILVISRKIRGVEVVK